MISAIQKVQVRLKRFSFGRERALSVGPMREKTTELLLHPNITDWALIRINAGTETNNSSAKKDNSYDNKNYNVNTTHNDASETSGCCPTTTSASDCSAGRGSCKYQQHPRSL
jgi:hypothetical protein